MIAGMSNLTGNDAKARWGTENKGAATTASKEKRPIDAAARQPATRAIITEPIRNQLPFLPMCKPSITQTVRTPPETRARMIFSVIVPAP